MSDIPRPKVYLDKYSHRYPGIWRMIDQFRAARGKDIPDWPDWCFLPISAIFSIVICQSGYFNLDIHDPQQQLLLNDIGALSALAPWRVTQGVYRFDPNVYQEVIKTPITGNIPHEILYQLPEWCVYIETPELEIFGAPIFGFFAYLEYDIKEKRTELRFVLDRDGPCDFKGPKPFALHLGKWPLEEAILRAFQEAAQQIKKWGWNARDIDFTEPDFIKESAKQFQPLISLLLYLCASNGEIEPVEGRLPTKPKPKKTKKGVRLFPPNKPTTWDVGVRMGAAIRRARAATTSEDRGGTHASPRPHIRRAHWHTFWTGPRKDSEKRKPVLKWLSPMLIGGSGDDLPVTIRKVEK